MSSEERVDELDIQILKEYIKDSRVSFRKIAEKLKVSAGTVLARTKKLEKMGVIKSYTVEVDYRKLGYSVTAVTEITVSGGKLIEVENQIASIPNTFIVYDITGENDVVVISKFKSTEELSKFTKSLLSIPNVVRTNTHVVLTPIKESMNIAL